MSQSKERLYYLDEEHRNNLRNFQYHYRIFLINIFTTKELSYTISMTESEFMKLFPFIINDPFDDNDLIKLNQPLHNSGNFNKPLSDNVKKFLLEKEIVKNIQTISSVHYKSRCHIIFEDMNQYANIMKNDDNEIMIVQFEELKLYCKIIFS
jgi:hypothetical protein